MIQLRSTGLLPVRCFCDLRILLYLIDRSDGGRVSGGQGAGGFTGQPALIYIPPGEYLISSKIQMFVNTQIIGGMSSRLKR